MVRNDELADLKTMVLKRLNKIYDGLQINSSKMTSSAMFIDYFVHDMLDYTVLTNENESSKFVKTKTSFDIRDAIKEIYQILEDKATMKEISIEIKYENFLGNYMIKTDQKRLQ